MGGYVSVLGPTKSGDNLSSEGTCKLTEKWNPKRPVAGDVVLIPVDDSSHADAAFDWYMHHVHKPNNVARIVHCVDLHFTRARDFRDTTFKDELEQKKRTSQYIVQKYNKRLVENGVKGSVQAFVGVPGEVIIDYAIRTNTSMIVMGSRGLSLLRRTYLGSVSEFVINHTKVPVTVIPGQN